MIQVRSNQVDSNSLRAFCQRSKRQQLLVCASPECANCAFVCAVDDGCVSPHIHQQVSLLRWDKYFVPFQRALKIKTLQEQTLEGDVPDEQRQLLKQDPYIKDCFLRLPIKTQHNIMDDVRGVSRILEAILKQQLNDVTGRDMRKLTRVLQSKELTQEVKEVSCRESKYAKLLEQEEEKLANEKEPAKNLAVQSPTTNPWKWSTIVLFLLLIGSLRNNPKSSGEAEPLVSLMNNITDDFSRGCMVEDMDSGQLFLRRNLSCRSNNTNGVLVCLEKKDVDTFQDPDERVRVLLNQQQYKEVIDVIDSATAITNYTTPFQHYMRGKANMQLGKFESALPDLEQAALKDSKNTTYLQEKALCLRKLQRYKEAIQDLDKAITINGTNGRLYRDKGIAFFKLGKYEDSLRLLEKSLPLQKQPHQTYFYMSMTYQTISKHLKALDNIDKAIAMKNDVADYHLRRAMILTSLGRKAEAEQSTATARQIKA